jgi:hypothetical protein
MQQWHPDLVLRIMVRIFAMGGLFSTKMDA